MGSDSQSGERGRVLKVRPGRLPPEVLDELDADLRVAAGCGATVLLTAAPSLAVELTCEIAFRNPVRHRGGILVLDCHALNDRQVGGALYEHLVESVDDRHNMPRTLLLREVHRLGAANQGMLCDMLESLPAGPTAPRIIASSSPSLYSRVKDGGFDIRLFYRLNTITLSVDAIVRRGRRLPDDGARLDDPSTFDADDPSDVVNGTHPF